MEFIEVGGARVPALGFGTFALNGEACYRATRSALDLGYRHVDTAQNYGNEREVGRAIADSGIDREAVFLTTKIWFDCLAEGDLQRTADACLERLAADHVDLLLIHWPSERVPLGESLEAIEAVRAAGKARHIGVSNFPVRLMKAAVEDHGARVICNQVEYHPFLDQTKVLDYARAHGLMVTAYSPVAQGRVGADATLRRIGEAHGKTPAQVALRWLLDQALVAAIPKAAKEQHCRENIDIFDFTLSEADRAAIDALRGGRRLVDPGWAPRWDPV